MGGLKNSEMLTDAYGGFDGWVKKRRNAYGSSTAISIFIGADVFSMAQMIFFLAQIFFGWKLNTDLIFINVFSGQRYFVHIITFLNADFLEVL